MNSHQLAKEILKLPDSEIFAVNLDDCALSNRVGYAYIDHQIIIYAEKLEILINVKDNDDTK